MATELEKIINGEGTGDIPPAPPEKKETPEIDPATGQPKVTPPEKIPEELQKEEHLANLDKAIKEGEEELSRIRKEKKDLKDPNAPEDPDDVPDFNEDDPNVKALDKRIRKNTAPINAELEKEKAEVRAFALREFLNANPALARDPQKVKEMMSYYEKIRTASERTREGVLLDLRKAAAVVFHDEILNAAQGRRAGEARADEAFSSPAISSGNTGYRAPKGPADKQLTAEDRAILARWGITPEQWQEENKKYGQQ